MRKFQVSRPRVLVVGAICILAGYTGVRTAADVSTILTFKGQQLDSAMITVDADGNFVLAQVICITGNDGNSNPTPVRKAAMFSEIDTPDTIRYASTPGFVEYAGTYSPIDNVLKGTGSCDATAGGAEVSIDLSTWEATDHGPVTLHGTTTTGNPTQVVNGISTTIVRDRNSGTTTRYRSRGRTGLNPSGTIGVEITQGGSGALPPVDGEISSDWSSVSIVNNSTFNKIHH